MDKKNTMLLTVIAVATLLVAVVGATFAYFSVTTNTTDATTTVTANTGKVGTVTVAKAAGPYTLSVTAQDMAKPELNDIKYYAVDDSSKDENTTGGIWKKDESPNLSAGTITLSDAGEKDTVKCSFSVKVDLSGTMVGNLQEGDAFITLSGISSLSDATEVDLKTGFTHTTGSGDSDTATQTFTSTGTLDLTMNDSSKELKADVWLVNSKTVDQSSADHNLANKNLTVKITPQISDCTTTTVAGD